MLKIESEILSCIQSHPEHTGRDVLNAFFTPDSGPMFHDSEQFLIGLLEKKLIWKSPADSVLSAHYRLTTLGVYSLQEYLEQQEQTTADKAETKRQKNIDHVLSVFSGALAAILSALAAYFVQFLF